ncbi:Nitrogen permease regulator 2 [Lobosporangium transversale]|uniref:Nitrogen permease regulator 2-domain-containing protein n=1 Tax=Lobosporangium transversale TaxID=64571 RepID=A0A1Y2G6V7_9FUNG|nr:nitrogen permease regulator 2-domain-containing protein [Lobosporangium transversale]KAF9915724.1 Nitrogen permease regulator 2 [Lobosporangium transversale]ORY99496.1 nitrogen permease regulator 2-domain-containing protein [Lobosporangium transversale]|eukprot:XP_021875822.1 nitrogen permease regulator 2-domain-containing protein [Lobosporangium transversale]
MGFPRLLSIFYCTFHPVQGPKVLYEVPEGSILSKSSPLVDFDSISDYLIPKVELCEKLVTISTPTCKVMGYPVNLEHKKFQRNALMFNLAFVFDRDAETSSYGPVVRKMARVLKALEKESEFLSRQTRLAMLVSAPIGSLTNVSLASASATTTPLATPTSAVVTLGSMTNNHAGAVKSSFSGMTGCESNQVNSGSNGSTSSGLEPISESASAVSGTDPSVTQPAQTQQTLGPQGAPVTPSLPPLPSSSNIHMAPEASLALVSTSQAPIPTPFATVPVETQDRVNIMPTTMTSSPPSMINDTITSVLTAPPSSMPFLSSKSSSTSAIRTPNNGSVPSGANGQKALTPVGLVALTKQEQEDGSGMQNLIDQLIEDLNSYCECQIPIDSANTINLKLFPTYPNPPPVYDYQVPISTVNLEALTDVSWDMTMQRLTGFINGVSSVKRIAEYADVETGLARMCMQHLLYYGCIIMVDLFQFKNIYAVKMEMMRLTEDVALQNECVSYVTLPDMHAPSFAKLFSLYCSLQYGVVLQDWIEQNQIADYNIDVRRFISFGVIKGFLYRVHKYPILDYHDPTTNIPLITKPTEQHPSAGTPVVRAATVVGANTNEQTTSTGTNGSNSLASRQGTSIDQQKKDPGDTQTSTELNGKHHTSTSNQSHISNHHANESAPFNSFAIPPALKRLLNGEHHYDELCTMFGCSVREMDQILAMDKHVKFIYR